MYRLRVVCLTVTLGLPLVAGCGRTAPGMQDRMMDGRDMMGGQGMMGQPGMMQGRGMMGTRMSMKRHRYVMHNGLDSAYRSLSNPLVADRDTVQLGRSLYGQHCAGCHGDQGRGDGPAGRSLDPLPTNIAAAARMPIASDAYLFWTIAEGGARVGSAMPPFKRVLESDEIWSVIHYIRRL